jgi:hypothetical protein
MSCDSVFIDSIIFAEFPSTGNHVVFEITAAHYFLYAPNFVVCSDNNIDFSDTNYGYFSLYGTAGITPSYGYTNINIPDNIFEGYIVVDNSANALENCMISFSTTVPQSTSINDNLQENKIKISPNPANDHISIELNNDSDKIKNIVLMNVLGRQQNINDTSSLINITAVLKGLYILQLY